MEVIMREATSTDIPGILSLYAQLGQDDGSVLPVAEAEIIFEKIRSYPDYWIYLAIMGDRPVGTFALLIMDNIAHMGIKSAILEEVVVSEELRGQGIGTKMMDYAHDLCRQAGCYKMTFSSNLKREAAHRFYESIGFQRHGYSFYIDYN
ncbi:MAG TPA: GNAT family N-acetyltransferase [Desulfuromonadales bacterium]|nr:GNAT family N-acetyltransferase [Desulfuromonadales bacterium]